MNDDFLYRLRTDPPAQFANGLKARLDRAPRRGIQVLLAGMGVLLFGTALAVVSPTVRHTVLVVFEWMSGSPSQELSASNVRSDEDSSNKGLARAFGDRPVTATSDDQTARDIGDLAADGIDSEASAARRRGATDRATAGRLRTGLPRMPHVTRDSAADDGNAGSDANPDGNADRNADADGNTNGNRGGAANKTVDRFDNDRDSFAGRGDSSEDSGFIVTGPLLSEPGTAARQFESRRALFTVMQWTMESVDRMVLRREFTAQQVEQAARRLQLLAGMLDEQFALDERTQNIQTRSLPDIWERRAEFTRRVNDLVEAANAFNPNVRPGNGPALMRQAARVRQACVTCHLAFRKDGDRNVGAVYP